MVVKRKPIFKKAVARNKEAVKRAGIRKRLVERFPGIGPRGNGRIELDPREWNGGFNEPSNPQDDAMRMSQQLQAQREGGGEIPSEIQDGFRQAAQQFQAGQENGQENFENNFRNRDFSHIKNDLKRSLQNFRGLPPTSGGGGVGSGNPSPGGGMIHLDPREWGGNGGFGGEPQRQKPMPMPGMPIKQRPMPMPMPGGPKLQPGSGGGMIHLDPREWGGNGGFGGEPQQQKPMPMPGMPRPPMSGGQKPMPMPQMPNPGMKPMPMPNPRRNLIPRPIDPRYKMS